jgi:hypothetical protein
LGERGMLKRSILTTLLIILAFPAILVFTTNVHPVIAQTYTSQSVDLSGNWTTSWGQLDLIKDLMDETKYTGYYSGGPWPDGQINVATLSGNTLQGQWFSTHGVSRIMGNVGSSGFFKFTLSGDYQSFTGSYWNQAVLFGNQPPGNPDGEWSGTKLASPTKHLNIDIAKIPYTETCHLTVTVSDAENGVFIDGASLDITVTDPNGQANTLHDFTDTTGHYQWDLLWGPGDVGKTWQIYVEASKEGYKLASLSSSVKNSAATPSPNGRLLVTHNIAETPNHCDILFSVTDGTNSNPVSATLSFSITNTKGETQIFSAFTGQSGQYTLSVDWFPEDVGKIYSGTVTASADGYLDGTDRIDLMVPSPASTSSGLSTVLTGVAVVAVLAIALGVGCVIAGAVTAGSMALMSALTAIFGEAGVATLIGIMATIGSAPVLGPLIGFVANGIMRTTQTGVPLLKAGYDGLSNTKNTLGDAISNLPTVKPYVAPQGYTPKYGEYTGNKNEIRGWYMPSGNESKNLPKF